MTTTSPPSPPLQEVSGHAASSARTVHVPIFNAARDAGYLAWKSNWWFDSTFPHAFQIFDLDGFYPQPYFATDHVEPLVVSRCTDAVLDHGARLLGRPVRSILELGCGGGWFTSALLERGLDVVSVEGSRAGIARAVDRGVPRGVLVHHDLRMELNLQRQFDLVMCTEVAEHIEPPFSSQLVSTIAKHAGVAWFSFEPPETNQSHYHHCNEQPDAFWTNLFAFYGFAFLRLDDQFVTEHLGRRGKYIFYRPECTGKPALDSTRAVAPLGNTPEATVAPSPLRAALASLVPPIVPKLLRRLRRTGERTMVQMRCAKRFVKNGRTVD